MNPTQRAAALHHRSIKRHPWHGPPHANDNGLHTYLITASCFEHAPIIGQNPNRMAAFESDLLQVIHDCEAEVFAWCILPNHYHVVARTDQLANVLKQLGRLHGRSSHTWNGEDSQRGRKVWFRYTDRRIKSANHFWSTINYVHHNPVRHNYVDQWQDWPYSSACDFINSVGRERAIHLWSKYTIQNYGDKWDH